MYSLQIPHEWNCHQPRCPRNALLQLLQVTNTLLSPYWWSGTYIVITWNYAFSFWIKFSPTCPIVNNAGTSLSVYKLIVRTGTDSMVISHTMLSQSEWWYWYVQGENSLVTSVWLSAFKMVWIPVSYWQGRTSGACLIKRAWEADWQSTCLVMTAMEQSLKHVNTYCVDSCFWDIKLLDCRIQSVMHFHVAVIRQFVTIH